MFILNKLNIEAKRSKLVFNCESSKAKRTCSIVEKIILKRSKHVYIEEFEYRSEATGSIVILYLKKLKKANFFFFLKRRAKNERVR